MSDIRKLLDVINETTVAGSVATVAAPMSEVQKRVEETATEETSKPEVIEYGMWENSALTTTSKLKKNRDKSAKVVKSIYGEDVQAEAANPKQQAAIAIAKKKEVAEGKFTVNARTGAKLDPRTGAELPPKEKPLTMKDMFSQPKSTAPKLTLDAVWRKVEDVVGQIFPDGDPIDYLAPWLEKHGIRDFKIGEILDRAAKKNGYEDLYDYYDSMKDQYARDNVAEMDNRTPQGDRREQRADSPEAIAQREKQLQAKLKKVSPEMRKKLRLPDPKEGVAEARIDEFYDEKSDKPEGGKLDRLVRRSLANKIPVFVLFDNKTTKSGYVQSEHPVKGFLVIGSGRKTYTTFNDETQKATKDGNRVYIQPRSMWNASRELDLDEGVAEDSSQKTFKVVYYSKKTDRNVTKTIKANNQSQVWDQLKSKGIDVVSVKEQGLNEFAPDDGSGGEEETLHKYARMWYNGDLATQQQVDEDLSRRGFLRGLGAAAVAGATGSAMAQSQPVDVSQAFANMRKDDPRVQHNKDIDEMARAIYDQMITLRGQPIDRRQQQMWMTIAREKAAEKLSKYAPGRPAAQPQSSGFPSQGSERRVSRNIDNFESQGVAEGTDKTIWVKPSSNHTLIVVKSSSPDIEVGEEYDEGDLNNYANNFGYNIKEQGVAESALEESDLILNPASLSKLSRDLVSHEHDRTDHEVEMAKSDLYQAGKNAVKVFELIKDKSEEEGLEGWVQEKIIKANDYLNTIREYLEGKQMESMDGVAPGTKMFTSEEKPGLWANIHAKRKRIKSGSGERMRKPGSKGAPSAQDFKNSAK